MSKELEAELRERARTRANFALPASFTHEGRAADALASETARADALALTVDVEQQKIEFRDKLIAKLEARVAALEAALTTETEECAKVAEAVGNFGDYQRHELTADYGQPRFDLMVAIVAAIRARALVLP